VSTHRRVKTGRPPRYAPAVRFLDTPGTDRGRAGNSQANTGRKKVDARANWVTLTATQREYVESNRRERMGKQPV